MNGLKLHHIGMLVESIEEALLTWGKVFGAASRKTSVAAQQVTVCMVPLGNGVMLELIEPAGKDSSLARLREQGVTYYHTAYTAPDVFAAAAFLEGCGFRRVNEFHSEAFAGKRCLFLMAPDESLIEIIEE